MVIRFLFLVLSSLSPSKTIVPLTTKYASLKPRKYDLDIDVLNFMFLPTEYWSLERSFTSICFFVTSFDTVEWFDILDILVFHFHNTCPNSLNISCIFSYRTITFSTFTGIVFSIFFLVWLNCYVSSFIP